MAALVTYAASSSSNSSVSGSPPASALSLPAVTAPSEALRSPTSLKRKRKRSSKDQEASGHDINKISASSVSANSRLLRRINGNIDGSTRGSGYGFSALVGKKSLGIGLGDTVDENDDKKDAENDDAGQAIIARSAQGNEAPSAIEDDGSSRSSTNNFVQITENEKREKRRKAELLQRQRQKLFVQQQKERHQQQQQHQQHESNKSSPSSKFNNPSSSSTSAATPKLPILPSKFLDLYSTPPRASTVDDPNLHCGRRRQNPHVEGQWPAHVYLEWHPSQQTRSLLSRLLVLQQQLLSLSSSMDHNHTRTTAPSESGPETGSETDTSQFHLHPLHHTPPPITPLPLHISLSAPLVLPSLQAATAFKSKLTSALKELRSGEVRVRLAKGNTNDKDRKGPLKWVRNADGSRWFLVIGIEDDVDTAATVAAAAAAAKAKTPPSSSNGFHKQQARHSTAMSTNGSSVINGSSGMSSGARYSYSRNHGNRSRNGIRYPKNNPTADLIHTATALSKAADSLPPLQSLIATTDAIAMRFGLRRFADGYGGNDGGHGRDSRTNSAEHRIANLDIGGTGGEGAVGGQGAIAGLGNPHISLAWTLQRPAGLISHASPTLPVPGSILVSYDHISEDVLGVIDADNSADANNNDNDYDDFSPSSSVSSLRREYISLIAKLNGQVLVFRQVKIKVGRDVCVVRLRRGREAGYGNEDGSEEGNVDAGGKAKGKGKGKGKGYEEHAQTDVNEGDGDEEDRGDDDDDKEEDMKNMENMENMENMMDAEDMAETRERSILGYT